MLNYALGFLTVGLIASALNVTGVSSVAVEIPLVLSLIGIVLVAMYMFKGRTARIA
jgi:uncharacterized membrane protein YtjA (UPF0391 family)